MPTEGDLAVFRDFADLRMTSRAAVRRKTGAMTTGADGLQVPEWATIHTNIPFRLGGANGGSSGTRTETIGGVEVQVATRVGHFPAGTSLADSDHIEITAGENVGLVLRIVEAEGADQQTARRVPVVSVQRPEEWA